MKKLIYILVIGVGMFLYSCSPKMALVSPATNSEGSVTQFVKLSANYVGFLKGNHEIKGPIKKEEIEGAVVSLSGGSFVITPETKYTINSEHKNGGVLRNVKITGDDPISLSDQSIWFVEQAFFKEEAETPDSLAISVISPDSIMFCMTLLKTINGDYITKVIYSAVKKKVYSNLVHVYSVDDNGNKDYVKFKKNDGSFIYQYKISKLPPRFFKDGKLKPEYKIQKIPIMFKNKNGKLVYKYSIKKVYEKDNAGFKFISPCGRVCYISNKNIKLQNIWVKQKIDDRRQMIYSKGYKSPNGN